MDIATSGVADDAGIAREDEIARAAAFVQQLHAFVDGEAPTSDAAALVWLAGPDDAAEPAATPGEAAAEPQGSDPSAELDAEPAIGADRFQAAGPHEAAPASPDLALWVPEGASLPSPAQPGAPQDEAAACTAVAAHSRDSRAASIAQRLEAVARRIHAGDLRVPGTAEPLSDAAALAATLSALLEPTH